MSTKYGRNFTNFQNVSVSGSGTVDPVNTGMFEMQQGLTNAASTVSVAMIPGGINGSVNGTNEHPYFHISNAGLSIGTGFIRMTSVGSSPYATLALGPLNADAAYKLPGLTTGILVNLGTISVGLESIGANAHYSTTVLLSNGTLTDTRRDAAYMFGFNRLSGTATTRGIPVYIGNTPSNTGVELFFINPSATATAAGTWEMNYICAR